MILSLFSKQALILLSNVDRPAAVPVVLVSITHHPVAFHPQYNEVASLSFQWYRFPSTHRRQNVLRSAFEPANVSCSIVSGEEHRETVVPVLGCGEQVNLTISNAPLSTPHKILENHSSSWARPSSGNSTKSASGFSSNNNENCLLSLVQLTIAGEIFRKILNPI